MSDPILTHEQKVEKLLSQIVILQSQQIAIAVSDSGIPSSVVAAVTKITTDALNEVRVMS